MKMSAVPIEIENDPGSGRMEADPGSDGMENDPCSERGLGPFVVVADV
jgi:hypothetical protein